MLKNVIPEGVMELLKSVDTWFLILAVALLGGYYLWSIRNLFNDLKKSIDELKLWIQELFKIRNDHESRIVKLETRMSVCESCNGHKHHRLTDEND